MNTTVENFILSNSDLFCQKYGWSEHDTKLAVNNTMNVSLLSSLFVDLIWSDCQLDDNYNPINESIFDCNWFTFADFDDRYLQLFELLAGFLPQIQPLD